MNKLVIGVVLTTFVFIGCNKKENNLPLFKLLRKEATGLDFDNTPIQNGAFNVLKYMYFFNGGGVASGDYNNDGLIDLFFTANQSQNKLFINKGNLRFEDVTEKAGLVPAFITGNRKWNTGASVVDINSDGMLDIYVNGVGDYQNVEGQNELWVCQGIKDGIPYYEDLAIRYGLDLQCFGTQAAFFDYDLDGDLDMYQLNHSLHQNGTFGTRKSFVGKQHATAGDKLLRNDNGKFVEVTAQANIQSNVIGYGLGIVTGDVNNDGWPDIYIGNDFHENDYLYINQQDGSFKEMLTQSINHTSRFSMGVECGDINNDSWPEIISLDMQPEDPYILKSSQGQDDYATFSFKLTYGYDEQFTYNNLQLNLGLSATPKTEMRQGIGLPKFAETSQYADISSTDWSWSPLFFDFDHDGAKDLFISNGIPRRMNDIDYVSFMSHEENKKWMFVDTLNDADLKVVERMPKIKIPNKFFKNQNGENRGLPKFEDVGKMIVNSIPSYSNGSIYADLDNDGDLDIVTNNIEDEPFVYQNLTIENNAADHNYLNIKLKGSPTNVNGIGARAIVFKKNGEKISCENFAVRGYQSSMVGPLHLGIGDTAQVDSIVVIWPGGKFQRLQGGRFNTTIEVNWEAAKNNFDYGVLEKRDGNPFQFEGYQLASQPFLSLDFTHKENPFVEFNREALIPHMVSAEGPALAIGDVNGDGKEDVFFGGAKRQRSALYLQGQGGFALGTPASIIADSIFEDVDAAFADLDMDGDLDIAIAAGGNEYWGKEEPMKQHWYRNDGKGMFQRVYFPDVYMTASSLAIGDFDGDKLPDVFLGARALPWKYGLVPNSVLLRNKGNGQFEQVSDPVAPGLADVGLVKDATWADVDANGKPDLVLAMEWGPVTIFYNDGKTLKKSEIRNSKSEMATGWWNFALPYDFDGDGDLDILAGNTGKNSRLKTSPEQPVRMYVADFDQNEQVEQLLTYFLHGVEMPFATHDEFVKQMPSLKKKFLYAHDFAKASAADLVGKKELDKAIKWEANEFRSMYFENTGNGSFQSHPLPDELQLSVLGAATLADLDGDGKMEVILHGNFTQCNIEMGRYDAFYGNVLRIGKHGKMEVFTLGDQFIDGEVRHIGSLMIDGKQHFIFARNNQSAVLLRQVQNLQ